MYEAENDPNLIRTLEKPVGERQMQRRVKARVEAFFKDSGTASETQFSLSNNSAIINCTTVHWKRWWNFLLLI